MRVEVIAPDELQFQQVQAFSHYYVKKLNIMRITFLQLPNNADGDLNANFVRLSNGPQLDFLQFVCRLNISPTHRKFCLVGDLTSGIRLLV